jgi:CRP-like cAMP-binding protein
MVKAVNPDTDDDLSSITLSGSAGDVIYSEQDEGTEMFVIQSGQIELTKVYGGEVRQIAKLGTGDFFGEMSLLEEQQREATATAITDYKLVTIDPSTFDELIQQNPEIAVRMLRKLSKRLMEVHEAEARAHEIAAGALGSIPKKSAEDKQQETGESRREAYFTCGPNEDRFRVKASGITTIGRYDRSADYRPDVDLTSLDTDTVSRRHARVLVRSGNFLLQQEIARNGTFVNGRKLNKGETVTLEDGDKVAFGTLEMVFHRSASFK